MIIENSETVKKTRVVNKQNIVPDFVRCNNVEYQ